ncbi:M23 family metallopeptidase [Marinobacter sp.]|uniref:M23 family metallopeptidase n=1 Tax=Marinobacter sp. TaxID=50741 RepID=UPI00356A5F22
MNIILVGRNHGRSRVVSLNARGLAVAGFIALLLVALCTWAGYRVAIAQVADRPVVPSFLLSQWQGTLEEQQQELARLERDTREQVDAMTLRLGEMQGRLLRLDALGQRFIESGAVASDEFNFDEAPAVGGPEEGVADAESFSTPELTAMITDLDQKIRDREQQLRLLDTLISSRRLEDERFVAGRPITWGWLSSRFGYRSDPFTGKRTWHNGVDLAGREDSDIISVAAGVVTFAGDRQGYGNLVEVDHGEGLVTRYAHAKAVEVEVGQVVQKGQVIARMGSTGRSTGPHVHFEVLQGGKAKDPVKYMQRASR